MSKVCGLSGKPGGKATAPPVVLFDLAPRQAIGHRAGGFFPVQIRFTPSHGNFSLAVCSPGDISPSWMVVFIPASGRPFSVMRTLPAWSPEVISHTLSLVARLDADGYSQASIISVLAMEGTL